MVDNNTTKAVTDASDYRAASISFLEGSGSLGTKRQPFDSSAGVDSFRSWVYAAALINANGVSSVPLRLYVRNRGKREKVWRTRPVSEQRKQWHTDNSSTQVRRKLVEFDDFDEVTERHPILELLSSVNPRLNGYDMTVLRVLWGELTGNAYMLKVHGEGEALPPTELWPLPPQWTWVVPDESGDDWIKGYVYGKDFRDRVEFMPDEIVHFRRPNPRDLFYGMGRVEAAWSVVELNDADHDRDLALSQNHARPDYAVILQGATPEQASHLDGALRRKLRGTKKAGTPLVLAGNDVSLQPLSWSPKDMGGREDTLREIAAVFGVPESMLRLNDANLASSQTGHGQWREQTILPLCRMDEQQLNQDLVWPYFGDDYCVAYDNPVPSDRAQDEAEGMAQVTSGRVTINEWRERSGLESIEGGDVLRVNGVSIEALDEQATAMAQPAFSIGAPAALDVDEDDNEVEAKSDPVVLDAAQAKAAQAILRDVATGDLPAAAAALLLTSLGISSLDAQTMVDSCCGQASATTPKPVDTDDDKPAIMPVKLSDVTRIALDPVVNEQVTTTYVTRATDNSVSVVKDLSDVLWSDDEPACTCHTKADADDTVREDEPSKPAQQYAKDLADIFERQAQAVASHIASKSINATLGTKINTGTLTGDLKEILAQFDNEIDDVSHAFLTDVVDEGGHEGINRLNQLTDADIEDVFTVDNPKVVEFIDNYTIELRPAVQRTTLQRITNAVSNGVATGATPADIASSILETAPGTSERRANAIARTESARAYVEGQHLAWEDTGVVEGKQWLLAPSACEFCQAVAREFNNKTVPTRGQFYPKGHTLTGTQGGRMRLDYRAITGPPLHPNDRCDTVPVLIEESS